MMATAPQQAPVGAHRGPARRSRQESRRTPQTQPHPPGLRPLAQGRQEVGVSTFSEHNVRVEALEGLQKTLHRSFGFQRVRVLRSRRGHADRFHWCRTNATEDSVVHRTVPFAVEAHHAKVVHDSIARPWNRCRCIDVNPVEEFEVMGRQPSLHRINVNRKQRVMTMKASVVNGACQLQSVARTLERHFKHRFRRFAQRHRGFNGNAVNDPVVETNLWLIQPHVERAKPFR